METLGKRSRVDHLADEEQTASDRYERIALLGEGTFGMSTSLAREPVHVCVCVCVCVCAADFT